MNREEILYLVPYLISLALSVGVFLYSWQHRAVRSAVAYTWFVGGQTLSIFGFIMKLISPGLESKILWDKFLWIAQGTIIIVAYLAFSIQFTEYKLRRPVMFWIVVLAIPALFNVLVITDSMHHLIYPNPRLITEYPFPDLDYSYTLVVYIFALYVYITTFFGIGLLLRRAFRPQNLYRAQSLIIAAGFFIPVSISILALLNIRVAPQRDATPFTFAIGNLIVAWGLFRYRVFDIVPIARERVLENMTDAVFVIDALGRVVDVNHAALTALGKITSQVVGQPSRMVFSEWPDLVEQFKDVDQGLNEISIKVRGNTLYCELGISPIYDGRKQLLGRVVVLHDITKRKTLEDGYRQLSEELEQRVKERTRELAEAYDTTLEGWAKALELRDKETEGHSRRVTELTMKLARAVGVSEDDLIHIYRGAIIHDIGKMAIPDEILRKADTLTQPEWEIVRKHPAIAYELLARIPYLKKALEIPYCHHEKWDGTGYPRGLKGEEIPLSARIFTIADVWDAVQSNRPYNNAWSKEKTIDYMKEQSEKYFDPKIVDVFLELQGQGKI